MSVSSGKRVYRAVAHYADGDVVTRHFLTKRSRDRWAKHRREGYPAEAGTLADVFEGRPAIPPATKVEVADSEPVVFS